MKAYKSLESYNFFVSGWVHSILAKEVQPDKVLIFSRVKHSQRARETPLSVWILSETNVSVIAAHSSCMAGLAEACSHVGATLFALETGVRMRSSTTCTQEKSKWLMPAYVKDIPYIPVNEMDFTSAKKKFDMLQTQNVIPTTSRRMPANDRPPSKATDEEMANLFHQLSMAGTKPAILSLVPGYSDGYKPSEMCHLAPPLTSLFKPEKPESLPGRVTRLGRKYLEAHQFSSVATRWGCNHEKKARDYYVKIMTEHHESFTVADSGLLINPKWPHLGASPDGVVLCDCCGEGLCEVKCPFCHKNESIETLASNKKSCLIENDGKIQLDRNHAYFYQVQAQINIAEVAYCDFIVWTESSIHIERVTADTVFWDNTVIKATSFFKKGILPELLGKWHSKAAL
ncbi:hypothetical protein AWC38_SpisGene20214 [Stylophora pistillata]|uniref:YqaJ viral recombinase domain-containing protein n=1 Tax=Stylophora pistillata TaxID=50429 RepID=A0A2B4RH33_STYPI|nr:hypothetical protein AWC38_SpisGene20214 [Stylophora pistillata]